MSAARHLAALFALLLGAFGSSGLRAQTLKEAVEQTLKTNPEVLIEVARQDSTREALQQAKGGYLPKIDLSTGGGKEKKDNATVQSTYGGAINQRKLERSLTLTQMLFDGFATAGEVARNQARVESADHKIAATSEQTALKAVENYLEVLRLRELLELTQANLLIHQRTLDQIKIRVTGGMARKSDLDQIEARLALAGSNLTSAEANLDIAAINYKLVVGSPPKTLGSPKPPGDELIPSSPEEAVFFAIENSRFLRSAEADVEAARAQHRVARAGMYPRLDLEMGRTDTFTANSVDNQKDLTNYLMLRMRYNIFRGGADEGRIGETRYQAKEAQEVRNRAERQLEQSVRLAWSAYRAARDRLPNLRKHAESALLTREAYTKQFSLGQRTLLDLLDTENEHFTAATNNINGYYVELFSRYRLLAEMNQLLATIGVSPSAVRAGDVAAESMVPGSARTSQLPGFNVITPELDGTTTPDTAPFAKPSDLPAVPPSTLSLPPAVAPTEPAPSVAPVSPVGPVTPVAPTVPASPVADPASLPGASTRRQPQAETVGKSTDTEVEAPSAPPLLPKSTEAARLKPLNVEPALKEAPAAPGLSDIPVLPGRGGGQPISKPPGTPEATSPTQASPQLSAPIRTPAQPATDDFLEAPPELLFDPNRTGPTESKPGDADDFMDAPAELIYGSSANPLALAQVEKSLASGLELSSSGFWVVEIEGRFSREALATTWKNLQVRYSSLLVGKSMLPRRSSPNEDSSYRLYVARFASEADAAELCSALAANDVKCRSVASSAIGIQAPVNAPAP